MSRGSRFEARAERMLRAPRPVVWALVADTNRWDRAAGLSPGRYEWVDRDGRRLRRASCRELGFALEWEEPPYDWVEGLHLCGQRRFTRGPATAGGIRVDLEAAGETTRVRALAWVEMRRGPLAPLLGVIQRWRFARALRRYLDAIEDMIARAPTPIECDARVPAVQLARRLLAGTTRPEVVGERSPTDEVELARRSRGLVPPLVDPRAVERLVAHLRERPDEEVAQMRPFELAVDWALDRRTTLATFLHATRAGLLELRWQLNCPVCRVAAGIAEHLDELRGQIHCAACNIDYGLDFGASVEAVFQSHPAVRAVQPAVYCASSPAFLPHVWAQLAVSHGSSRDLHEPLPPGSLRLRSLYGRVATEVEVPPSRGLRVRLLDGAIEASPSDRPGLSLTNETGTDAVLLVERAGWSADAVLGSVIASLPEFQDLFATEAPAAGVDLTIGRLAVLFTDLTGSTAMYERMGDARAFALVQRHFRTMRAIVERHEGAVVKTMGDAIMACFTTARAAVAAALEMIRTHERVCAGESIGLKVGVHEGSCLAVRANDRLDFFGTTVNVAARLQARASSGQLVLHESLAQRPDVAGLLEGLRADPFDAALKGIAGTQRLIAIDVAGTPSASAMHRDLPGAPVTDQAAPIPLAR
ncbi:MAG: DUF5939 domain-containing protein [Myxococcota bacterium]|nr:DUF5939 domain-containing protein [Myxococcota bacterium]MDW8362283.1 adenylate/guanylate cyclase domain-containing protein [Myxococcales bacterium]